MPTAAASSSCSPPTPGCFLGPGTSEQRTDWYSHAVPPWSALGLALVGLDAATGGRSHVTNARRRRLGPSRATTSRTGWGVSWHGATGTPGRAVQSRHLPGRPRVGRDAPAAGADRRRAARRARRLARGKRHAAGRAFLGRDRGCRAPARRICSAPDAPPRAAARRAAPVRRRGLRRRRSRGRRSSQPLAVDRDREGAARPRRARTVPASTRTATRPRASRSSRPPAARAATRSRTPARPARSGRTSTRSSRRSRSR